MQTNDGWLTRPINRPGRFLDTVLASPLKRERQGQSVLRFSHDVVHLNMQAGRCLLLGAVPPLEDVERLVEARDVVFHRAAGRYGAVALL